MNNNPNFKINFPNKYIYCASVKNKYINNNNYIKKKIQLVLYKKIYFTIYIYID